jgi:DNA topoisomerase-1
MRTDSTRISEEALAQARQTIVQHYGQEYLPEKSIIYKNKRGAQDAHEAIRPSAASRHPESLKGELDKDLFRVYELIWRRFVACQMPPASFHAFTVDIVAGPGLFRATDSQLIFPGFLLAYPRQKEEDQQLKLPPLSAGERLNLEELIPKQHFTEPPPRFTEASLIRELERLAIGRPSTYAAILANVQQRDYTYKEKGRFPATQLGLLVTDSLISAFPQIFDLKFTAAMEQRLDKIEEGKRKSGRSLKRFYQFLQENVEKAKESMRDLKINPVATDVICEKCGSTMVIKWGKLGEFLACSSFPDCDYTSDLIRDKAGVIKPLKHETGELCEKCGQAMVPKTGRYGRFLACSAYPDCKNTKPLGSKKAKSLGINCLRPDCDGEIVERFSKKRRKFYGCNRFPKCNLAFWDKPVKKECPKCGSAFMLEKVSKDKGRWLSCAREDCQHNLELEG